MLSGYWNLANFLHMPEWLGWRFPSPQQLITARLLLMRQNEHSEKSPVFKAIKFQYYYRITIIKSQTLFFSRAAFHERSDLFGHYGVCMYVCVCVCACMHVCVCVTTPPHPTPQNFITSQKFQNEDMFQTILSNFFGGTPPPPPHCKENLR